MGIRIYAWRVDLTALRALVGSGDAEKARLLRAKLAGEPVGTLPGDDVVTAIQNWQMAGMGTTASPARVEALVMGDALDPQYAHEWVNAVITLCGVLGESITQYSINSYEFHYDKVEEGFKEVGVTDELLEFEPDLWFMSSSPPVDIPVPEDGMPTIRAIEAERVAAVAALLAKRGLQQERSAAFVSGIRAWGVVAPEIRSGVEAFLTEVEAILRSYPMAWDAVENSWDVLSDFQEDEVGSAQWALDYELKQIREYVASELEPRDHWEGDVKAVFDEVVRWFEKAGAAGQGLVLMLT